MSFEVRQGDCVELMAAMSAGSVDAVVCDPPYMLEFMGKDWDRPMVGDSGDLWNQGAKSRGVAGNFRRGELRQKMRESQAWHERWATEALRVLKPGGHLLAFGGTRTYHRLVCAVEDAGFEIRDTISWLYGSGFPKSLDVGKAIDRQRDDGTAIRAVTAFIAANRNGHNNQAIDAHFGFNGMAGHWTTQGAQAAVPTVAQWASLKALLSLSGDMDAEVWRLNGRKGQPGENWELREKVGEAKGAQADSTGRYGGWGNDEDGDGISTYDLTAPATPEAERWEGWGTALKPAMEPVVVARKPLQGTVANNVLTTGGYWVDVEDSESGGGSRRQKVCNHCRDALSGLRQDDAGVGVSAGEGEDADVRQGMPGEDDAGRTQRPVEGGTLGQSAGVRDREPGGQGERPAGTPSSGREGNRSTATSGRTGASPGREQAEQPPVEPRASGRDGSELAHEAAHTGGCERCGRPLHGTGALNVDGCRVDTGDDLNGGAYAKGGTERDDGWGMQRGQAGEYEQPSGRWPANVVLSHTEGCVQVGTRKVKTGTAKEPDGKPMERSIYGATGTLGREEGYASPDGTETVGAWSCTPDCPVRLLDEQTGELASGGKRGGEIAPTGRGRHNENRVAYGDWDVTDGRFFGDSGGASRFFYVAKASRAERNAGLEGFEEQPAGVTGFRATDDGRYFEFAHPAPEGVGEWLREAREAAGFSNSFDVAERVTGRRTGAVANWEAGLARPTPEHWRRLRDVLGVDDRYDVAMTEQHEVDRTLFDERQRKQARNGHPTVKPISLMRWLVRLVTPPGGTVLDPFTGSGTTGIASVLEAFDFIGLEREQEYVDIARARIAWWHKHRGDGEAAEILAAGELRDAVEATGQLGMFD